LLSLVVATGAIFSEGRSFAWPLNHKAAFSLASWLVFAGLLLGHRLAGWRGRRAANWTLAGFTLLLFGYLGARLLADLGLHI